MKDLGSYARNERDILSNEAKRACERAIQTNWEEKDLAKILASTGNEESRNDGMITQVIDPCYKSIWIIDKKLRWTTPRTTVLQVKFSNML